MINGQKILLYLNGNALAASKSAELSYSCDTIESASPSSGTSRDYVAGRTDWSITASWLVPSSADMKTQILRVGQTYTIRHGDSGNYLTGSAICVECRVDAAWGSLVKGSFKFKGTGPLT